MRINRIALKNNARTRILATRPSPLVTGAIFVLISYILNLLRTQLDGSNRMLNDVYAEYLEGNFDYLPALPEITPAAIILIAAVSLMSLILSAGFTIYCLKLCQGEKAGYKNLLDGFGIFFKVAGLEILMWVLVLLWSLLLIVPGIIASYRYRMALYIMIDNPELSIPDCIRRSKEMMDGRKLELFELDLSFIGWYLAAAFPLLSLWVTPYTSVTYASYYIALRDMPLSGKGNTGGSSL